MITEKQSKINFLSAQLRQIDESDLFSEKEKEQLRKPVQEQLNHVRNQ